MSIKNYKAIVISLVLLVAYITIFLSGSLSFLDEIAYAFLSSFQSSQVTGVMVAITFFGSWMAVVIICAICLLVNWHKGLFLSINVALVYALNNVIKIIIMRPRPSVIHLVYETGYSFPSGHAMVSFALYGILAYFVWKKYKVYSLLLMLCPLLIGMTRIYLGVHYVTDIIGGYLFALLYLCVIFELFHNHKFLTDS